MTKIMNVIVTGGSGFLGSHIADALTEKGHQVTVFDTKPSLYLKSQQKMIVGDILDYNTLVQSMKGADVVFHLAALADLDLASNRPVETMNVNVMGTVHVLEASRMNNVKQIIFASTIYVYSQKGSFYRVSKHACELFLEAYHERYGLEYTILRFGTLYGLRADELNSVYRYLKEALMEGKIEAYATGDEVREYIHVTDAARICVQIMEDAFEDKNLILTGHHKMKISEFLNMINEILGNHIDVSYSQSPGAHYKLTPYSYIPRVGKKIVMNTYKDLGESLIEILDEIHTKRQAQDLENELLI